MAIPPRPAPGSMWAPPPPAPTVPGTPGAPTAPGANLPNLQQLLQGLLASPPGTQRPPGQTWADYVRAKQNHRRVRYGLQPFGDQRVQQPPAAPATPPVAPVAPPVETTPAPSGRFHPMAEGGSAALYPMLTELLRGGTVPIPGLPAS